LHFSSCGKRSTRKKEGKEESGEQGDEKEDNKKDFLDELKLIYDLLYGDGSDGNVTISGNITAGGNTFPPNSHWVYYANKGWYQITQTRPYPYPPSPSTDEVLIQIGPNSLAIPSTPEFEVTFYQALQSKSWGTYGYLMNKGSFNETSMYENPSQ